MNCRFLILTIITLFVLCFGRTASASHALGGELGYRHLGGTQYELTLYVYRDCNGIGLRNFQLVNWRGNCGIGTSALSLQSVQEVSNLCLSSVSACNGGTGPYGVERYHYSTVVSIPDFCNDIDFSWQICCRNASITNLNAPGRTQVFIQSYLSNNGATATSPLPNSTPVFANPSNFLSCINVPINQNLGAIDPDGDSLNYSLVDCKRNIASSVQYLSGYSGTSPLGTGSPVTVNPLTGAISYTASSPEVAVICIQVDEYRNGILVGSSIRDVQLRIVNCPNTPPILSGVNNGSVFTVNACLGQTLDFSVLASDPDANILTINANTVGVFSSASFVQIGNIGRFVWTPNPSDVGTHILTMNVEDDACPLKGSNTYTYTVNVLGAEPPFTVSPSTAICRGDSVVLVVNSPSPNIATYNWFPTRGLSNTNTATVTARPTVTTTYTAEVVYTTGCVDRKTVTVEVSPTPIVGVFPNNRNVCGGSTLDLRATTDRVGMQFIWRNSSNTVIPSTTTGTNSTAPITIPNTTGNYVWTVDVRDPVSGCSTQKTVTLTVNQPMANSSCNTIHASLSGSPTGLGTTSDPVTLQEAINRAVCNNITIKLATGTYIIDSALQIGSYVTLEGGFEEAFGWSKTSQAGATTIQRSSNNPAGIPERDWNLSAIEIVQAEGFRLQDLTIEVDDANSNDYSASVYGIYMNDVSNYDITRVQVLVGDAANGRDGREGCDGNDGQDGGDGAITGQPSPGGAGGHGWVMAPGRYCPTALPLPVSATTVSPTGLGSAGNDGNNAALNSSQGGSGGIGGWGGLNLSGIYDGGNGGFGGLGGDPSGWNTPNAGVGQGSMHPIDPTDGDDGQRGLDGIDGNTPTVTLHINGRFVAGKGEDGQNGGGGNGGSGGGGTKNNGLADPGASGGSGGGGGAGAHGGEGGGGGGSSFGIYINSNGSNGRITDCKVVTGQAGQAGDGEDGGHGGNHGAAGDNGGDNAQVGGSDSGEGGGGGHGGNGGEGADGKDGVSSILYTSPGSVALVDNQTNFDLAGQRELRVAGANCVNQQVTYNNGGLPVLTNWAFAVNDPAGASPSNTTGLLGPNANTFYIKPGRYTVRNSPLLYSTEEYKGFHQVKGSVADTAKISTTALAFRGSPDTVTLCVGQYATFESVTSGNNYIWDFDGAIPNPGNVPITPNTAFNTAGIYTITLDVENSCCGGGIIDTLVLIVSPIPAINSATVAYSICRGEEVVLAVSGLTGTDTLIWIPEQQLIPLSASSVRVQPSNTTIYRATAYAQVVINGQNSYNYACPTVVEFTVTVNDNPVIGLSKVDIGCSSNGYVNAFLTGSNYDFDWSNGSFQGGGSTSAINVAVANSYTVTVTDNTTLCQDSASIYVGFDNSIPVLSFTNNIGVSCAGATDGSVRVQGTGGTGNYTFVWNPAVPGSNTSGVAVYTVTNLAAGLYEVTMTDNGNNCKAVELISVVEPSAITIDTLQLIAPTCSGQQDGVIEVEASGGTGNLSYLWSTGDTVALINNLDTGTYTVTITDGNNCTLIQSFNIPAYTVVFSTNVAVTSNYNGEDISCVDACDGTAAVTVVGSIGTYNYSWSNTTFGNTSTPTGLCADTFYVTVTNASLCSIVDTLVLTAPDSLIITNIVATATACSSPTGTAGVTVTGGSTPYSYNWSDGQTTATATNLPASATPYAITVTDWNGCTVRDTISVTQAPNPAPPLIQPSQNLCLGDTLWLKSTTLTGSSYFWQNSNSGFLAYQRDTFIFPATTSSSGIYTLTLTDALGCSSSSTMMVTINSIPQRPQLTGQAICVGDNLQVNNLNTCAWTVWLSPLGDTIGTSSSILDLNPIDTGYAAGNWTAWCMDLITGCISLPSSPYNMVIDSFPNNLTINNNSPICANGQASLSVSSPNIYNYIWSSDSLRTDTLAIGNTYTTLPLTSTTTFYLHALTGAGCATIQAVPVTLYSPAPTTTIVASATTLCAGDGLSLTTATPAASYVWSSPIGFLSATRTATVGNIQTVYTGWFNLTTTDVNGCLARDSVFITVNNTPTPPTLIQLASNCIGDSLRLSHSGGCDSSFWEGPTGRIYPSNGTYLAIDSANADYQNGTWTVYCLDTSTGCSSASNTLLVTLPVAPALGLVTVTNPVCVGDSAYWETTPIAGTSSYLWYNLDGTVAINGLRAGLANITRDTMLYLQVEQNGCIYTIDSAQVRVLLVPPAPVITGNLQWCVGDDLLLNTPTAAVSYTWTAPNGTTYNNQTLSIPALTVLDAGYYKLLAGAANGCTTALDSVFVQVTPRPATPTTPTFVPICATDSLILTITSACDSVVWTAPNGTQWTGERLAFAAGTAGYLAGNWEVMCIDTATGCSSLSGNVAVTIQTIPPPVVITGSPVCKGSNVSLVATTSINTVWYRDAALTDTAGTGSVLLLNNVQADSTYYVVNTSTAGCQSIAVPITNSVFPTLVTLDAGPDQVLCAGEDLFLTTTNSFVTYRWTGPNWLGSSVRSPIIRTATILNSGAYIVEGTDVNGCTSLDTVNVLIEPLPDTPSVNGLQIICDTDTLYLAPDTTISCDSMFWTAPNGNTIGGRQLQVLPTDSNFVGGQWFLSCLDTTTNCSSRSSVGQLVVILPPPVPQPALNNGPVCVGGAVTLSTASGTGFTQFYWYADSTQDSLVAVGQNPVINTITTDTTFYLVIDNGSGCQTAPIPTFVTIIPPTNTPTIVGDTSYCAGDLFLLSSNTAATAYQWTGPNGFSANSVNALVSTMATPSLSGVYQLTTVDSAGCLSLTDSITVVVHIPDSAAQLTTNAPICRGEGLQLISDGNCTSYEWVGPLGNRVITTTDTLLLNDLDPNYLAGTWYSICINNSTGCRVASDTIAIVLRDAPVLLGASSNSPICTGELVQLTAPLGTGGTVTVDWYGDAALQQPLSNPFVATTSQWVYVKATNSTGCSAIDSTYVVVYQLSTGNILPTSDTLCAGDPLVLNSLVTGSQYQWTGPNGYSSNLQQPAVLIASTTTAGQYFLVITDQNGCTRIDSMNIVVNGLPSPPSLSPIAALCAGDNFSLSTPAIAGYSYQWRRWPQGTVVSNNNTYTVTTSTVADSGQYYVVVSNGACAVSSLDTVLVTINTPPTITVFAGIDQQLCGQNSTVLTATGLPTGYTGTWTTNSGAVITQINNNTTTVNSLPLGTSVFYWTASQAICSYTASDSVQIIVQALGTDTAQAGVDQVICLPASTQLNATITATSSVGTWSQSLAQANAGVVITTPNQANTGVSGLIAGQSYDFVWSLNQAGCPIHSQDTVNLLVNTAPSTVAYAGNDIFACGADTLLLSGVLPVGANGTWSSANNLTFGDSSQAGTWVSGWNTDTTVVYWTLSGNTCRNYSQDSLLIINASISVLAEADVVEVVAGQPTSVYVLNNDQWLGAWQIAITSSLPNGQVFNQNDGWFDVVAEEGDSLQYFVYELCAVECPAICDTALVILKVEYAGDCTPPNIFTPNGDGVNDYFTVPCLDVRPNAYLGVFNRWGDQVYESDRYGNQWDGRHNGQPLPDGTYFFILRIEDQKPIQGSVEIRR